MEDSSCACGKRTRTSTGCDDLTGKWEYSEWSSCPQELPDETEACGEGLVGTKTRTASCNGNSYEYGEWNTDNCAPACKDEDLVLEETCEDGYAKKTRTKTGCGSDGQWEYTEWDESKCCKGAKVLEQACSSGCGKQTRSIEGCENGEWKYGNWSTCPTKPADESVACGSGYTGNKTRSATCKADNSGWEFKGDYNMQTCCSNNSKPATRGYCYCGTINYNVTCTKGTGTYGSWTRKESSRSCNATQPSQQIIGTCGEGYTNPTGKVVKNASCTKYWSSSGYYGQWRYGYNDTSDCGCYEEKQKEAREVRNSNGCTYGYISGGTFSCQGSKWVITGGTVTCSSASAMCQEIYGKGGTICMSDGCSCMYGGVWEPWDELDF